MTSLVVANSWSTVVDTALFREGDPVRPVKAFRNGVRNAVKDLIKGFKGMGQLFVQHSAKGSCHFLKQSDRYGSLLRRGLRALEYATMSE
jgi:hypothetical protein